MNHAQTIGHSSPGRRWRAAASWLVPGALLALIPKCPLCFAAYIAMVSGIVLPFSAASSLRTALLATATASLSYLIWRKLRRLVIANRAQQRNQDLSVNAEDIA